MTNLQYQSKEIFELAYATISKLSDKNAISFANDLPNVNQLTLNEVTANILPVVHCINSLGSVSHNTSELVSAIKCSYKSQAWRQPYSKKDIGEKFANGSAWFPIADINGPIVYKEGLMEVMLLNSGITYPKHSHNPEELYVILAGKVWWEADSAINSGSWKKAGEVIYHLPNQVHSITAGDKAVLILNLWRGGCFEMPNIT